MPAARFFLFFGVLLLPLAASTVVEAFVPWVLAADVALASAAVVDWRRARRTPLSAERDWPSLLVQDSEARLALRVGSSAARRVEVELREGLHPAVADSARRHRLVLRPGFAASWAFKVRPRRRGDHQLDELRARVLGPWKLAWSQRVLLGRCARRVYPQVRWGGRVGRLLALAHRHQLGHAQTRYGSASMETYGLREYLSGDAPNKVHWKATARHGHLVTREEVRERGRRLMILLDCARAMTSLDAGRSKLDHALATSLALLRVASAMGDRIHLIAFSDRVERVVRPGAGSREGLRAYRELYDLQPRLVEPAYDVAVERLAQLEARQCTVVLFTSVVDLAAAELLTQAVRRLGRRHRVLLVNLEDPELTGLAEAGPTTREEVFAKVTALEILLANRRLAARLRRGGVRVVATAADRMALETLGAYLAGSPGRSGRSVWGGLTAGVHARS